MTTKKTKQLLLEQLAQTPIVEVACKKAGVGRTTYYRLRKTDPDFAEAADAALSDSTGLMNDLCESQILTGARNGNLTAAIFWLKNRHPAYKQRTFQSGFAVGQDADENLYFEAFGSIKPETERLLEPYLQILDKTRYAQKRKGTKS
jgi:hypothetical protein